MHHGASVACHGFSTLTCLFEGAATASNNTFLDTPLFQRPFRKSQLALASLADPGAEKWLQTGNKFHYSVSSWNVLK